MFYTKTKLVKEMKQVISKIHGLKSKDIIIEFLDRWNIVKYPTGYIAKCARIIIYAVGFAPKRTSVSQAPNQTWHIGV